VIEVKFHQWRYFQIAPSKEKAASLGANFKYKKNKRLLIYFVINLLETTGIEWLSPQTSKLYTNNEETI
jgi:hypothetical protein